MCVCVCECPGAEKWGGLCDSGTMQSPIDLSIEKAMPDLYEPFDTSDLIEPLDDLFVRNTGHAST